MVDEGLGRGFYRRAHNRNCLLCVAQEDRQRLVIRALLDGEEPVNGGGIAAEADKAVDGIGGHADDGAPARRRRRPGRARLFDQPRSRLSSVLLPYKW